MSIRFPLIFALAVVSAAPALAEPLARDEAVRLFLGIRSGSSVTAEKIEVHGNDVTVKNLFMPMPEGEGKSDGPAKLPSAVKVQEMRFIGVKPEETTASFDAVSGTGILISGQQGLGAKSLAFGPLKVKDLGTMAFSVEGDLSFQMAEVVAMTGGDALRVSNYSLSFKGDPNSKFSQAVRIEGIRSDQWKTSGPSDGVQIDLAYQGDGVARTMDGTFAVRQSQFGEIKSQFSLVDSASSVDRLALVLGQNFLMGDPKLKSGSISFNPSEQIKMLLMFLPSDQRDAAVKGVTELLSDKTSVPEPLASEVLKAVRSFLANPSVVTVDLAPATPISLAAIAGSSSGDNAVDLSASLGVKFRNGF